MHNFSSGFHTLVFGFDQEHILLALDTAISSATGYTISLERAMQILL